jgi:hypothetical protein
MHSPSFDPFDQRQGLLSDVDGADALSLHSDVGFAGSQRRRLRAEANGSGLSRWTLFKSWLFRDRSKPVVSLDDDDDDDDEEPLEDALDDDAVDLSANIPPPPKRSAVVDAPLEDALRAEEEALAHEEEVAIRRARRRARKMARKLGLDMPPEYDPGEMDDRASEQLQSSPMFAHDFTVVESGESAPNGQEEIEDEDEVPDTGEEFLFAGRARRHKKRMGGSSTSGGSGGASRSSRSARSAALPPHVFLRPQDYPLPSSPPESAYCRDGRRLGRPSHRSQSSMSSGSSRAKHRSSLHRVSADEDLFSNGTSTTAGHTDVSSVFDQRYHNERPHQQEPHELHYSASQPAIYHDPSVAYEPQSAYYAESTDVSDDTFVYPGYVPPPAGDQVGGDPVEAEHAASRANMSDADFLVALKKTKEVEKLVTTPAPAPAIEDEDGPEDDVLLERWRGLAEGVK